MPAKVITVRRSRRSWFAVPRAILDWIRSLRTALFRKAAIEAEFADFPSADSRIASAPFIPRLVLDENDSHRCIGCHQCVRVCPSRCLTLATEGEGAGLRITRFELVHDACIGCGICDEACPEKAIEMVGAVRVEVALLSGRLGVTDLMMKKG